MINRTTWTAFAALCLLSGTFWVLPANHALPTLERQSLLFGVSALAALCFRPRRIPAITQLYLAIAGIGFFGLPIAVVDIAHSSVSETTRSALFAMVPVVVILAVVISNEAEGARRLLAPALLGLGGLLLLLPLQFSSSLRGQAMLALIGATVLLAGLCSVWLYRLLQGVSLPAAIALLGGVNSLFLAICAAVQAAVQGELLWRGQAFVSVLSLSSLVDVLEIAGIVWLLREMPPIRFSARYLLIPLVTIVESFVLVRPAITARMAFGTLLLAAGAGLLLLLKEADPGSTLSLR